MKNFKLKNLLIIPIFTFTFIFVFIPLLYIILLSFTENRTDWGVTFVFTLDNYKDLVSPFYLEVFFDSIKIATISTVIMIIISYPFAYFMAKLEMKWKKFILLLLMLPFWTSGLIRLYGWVIAFRSNGVVDKILMGLHITQKPLKLLYSYPSVILGMVYALTPFMILAIYSSAEKMDWSLISAARDLGASKFETFITVTMPLTLSGVLSGIILTFIPSMGLFFVADILGGNKVILVGTVIQELMGRGNNLPLASAISVFLMFITIFLLITYSLITKKDELEGLL